MARKYKRDSQGRFKGGGGGAKARAGGLGRKVKAIAVHPTTKAIALGALTVAADVAIANAPRMIGTYEANKYANVQRNNAAKFSTQKGLNPGALRPKVRNGKVKITTMSGKRLRG